LEEGTGSGVMHLVGEQSLKKPHRFWLRLGDEGEYKYLGVMVRLREC
jgi:hypothetical protein